MILRGTRVWLRPLPEELAYIEREHDRYCDKGYIDRATGRVLEDIPLFSVSRAACFAHGANVVVKSTRYTWRNEHGERPPMRSSKRCHRGRRT